ncbi:unnamed protein product [Macrosiphum euphorbiae]|uniref:Endonuclease/exonuclease/phosphatase domain-containing protein n=1 Tax=Macrosiphum euphorbiae TaxID=13131 RepID=A0AAV0VZD1_9HEMI|nr:unnamed protein product [Macrosiphum euphorbiae]
MENRERITTAVYKPPNSAIEPNDLDLLTNHNDWLIAAGDFNSKHPMWHSYSTNRAGRTLFKHAHLNDYSIVAPDTPAYFPPNTRYRPDVLDIAIVRTPLQVRITNLAGLSSEHNPIIMELTSSAITTPSPNSGRYINWRKFTNYLSQDLSDTSQNLNTTAEIEETISKLTNTVTNMSSSTMMTLISI